MNRLRHSHLTGLLLALMVAGCSSASDLLNPSAPSLTPVGSGVSSGVVMNAARFVPKHRPESVADKWERSFADLYRDQRARRVNDVVTVQISIDDRASLNSNINRSKQSTIGSGFDLALDWLGLVNTGNANLSASTDSSADGRGSISRSERIELSVAALVTDILPNGHLVISGSQEVRINNEVRELNVAGIVDPLHVSSSNTIAYDRIAEARVSYGGRGRVSDVQQPGFGQQLFDRYAPF
jgi:flagellar L-ring protein precursor FlgH